MKTKRASKRSSIFLVRDALSYEGMTRNQISQKTGLCWENVNNALEILKGLNLCYQDEKHYYSLFYKPEEIFHQMKAMHEIIERKSQYIDQLEKRIVQLKTMKSKEAKK